MVKLLRSVQCYRTLVKKFGKKRQEIIIKQRELAAYHLMCKMYKRTIRKVYGQAVMCSVFRDPKVGAMASRITKHRQGWNVGTRNLCRMRQSLIFMVNTKHSKEETEAGEIMLKFLRKASTGYWFTHQIREFNEQIKFIRDKMQH